MIKDSYYITYADIKEILILIKNDENLFINR